MIPVQSTTLGSTIEDFTDENESLLGLLFQDGIIKTNFAAYPEVLMVDATWVGRRVLYKQFDP